MPKQTHKIEGFHGGISSDTDPRDIKDIESPVLVDASVDSFGRIKTLGEVSATVDVNTCVLEPNLGLFAMDSDKNIAGADSNETFILSYNTNSGSKQVDVRDSSGWNTSVFGTGGSDLPIYYVGDGNLRLGDGNFDNAVNSQWFGYITDTRFAGLLSTSGSLGWESEPQPIAKPFVGKALMSTPFAGADVNGVNSSVSEYIGTGAGAVADFSSLNLRVGLQYTELHSNTAAYHTITGAGISTVTDDTTTYPPFIGNNNVDVVCALNASPNTMQNGPGTGMSFLVDEENVFIFSVYIPEAEFDGVDFIQIHVNSAWGSEGLKWKFDRAVLKFDCWNVLVCGADNITINDDYTFGITLDEWEITIDDRASLAPNVWFSGPITASATIDGFPPGLYTFYHTYLYDNEKQESLPFLFTDVDVSGNVNKLNVLGAPVLLNFDAYINPCDAALAYFFSKRITGSRLYFKLQENDNFYLIGELDFVDKGFKWLPDGNEMAYPMVDVTGDGIPAGDAWYETSSIVKGITPSSANTIDTFKSINGFGGVTKHIDAKFKTAVVHGRRTYIGNVRQPSGTSGTNYPDRMLKSQVNKFDIFPDKMGSVDVTINDGESIVKLEAYADRILQFKEKTMYIINVSESLDFLEDTHENKGCSFRYHVTKTDFGVAWFNAFGVYFYDGQKVANLLEKKGERLINEADWGTFITDSGDTDMSEAHIGYIPKKRQLLIKNENTDVFIYDFVSMSWTKGASKIPVTTSMTNFVLDGNQNLIYITGTDSDIMTWNPNPASSSGFIYQTKDIDFETPAVRKKIYRVYVTYKTGSNTNVQVKYDTLGGTSFNKLFQDGTNFTSNVLDNAGGGEWTTAILKPNTSSEANNIYSFAMKFTATGSGPEITRVVCRADVADDLNGTFFYVYGNGGKTSVWIDTDNSGAPASDPSIPLAAQNIEVTEIETNDSAEAVAIAVGEAVGDHADFTTSVEGDTVFITTTTTAAFTDASDSLVPTGFEISVDQQGGTASVPATFEINDITIVYRVKGIR